MHTLAALAAATQQNDSTMSLCGFALAAGIILVVVGGFAPFSFSRHGRLQMVLAGLVIGSAAAWYLATTPS